MENISEEEILKIINYLKDKLEKSTTDFDKFYWNLRIKDMENLISNREAFGE